MANEEQLEIDPLPNLHPNRRTNLGEGEPYAFMNILVDAQVEIARPPNCDL
jgi:hypothetical protein